MNPSTTDPITRQDPMEGVGARKGTGQAMRFVVTGVAAVLLLAVLRFALVPDTRERNLEFMPDMIRSPAVESQTRAAALPGGLSHQPLVPGVVTRDLDHVPFGPGQEEAVRAGKELESPFASVEAAEREKALDRGRDLYGVHCAVCHGVDGEGKGPAVMRGMLPPPTLAGASARGMPDGSMFHLIHFGRGNMVGLGDRMSSRDVWSVVTHVRILQEKAR